MGSQNKKLYSGFLANQKNVIFYVAFYALAKLYVQGEG